MAPDPSTDALSDEARAQLDREADLLERLTLRALDGDRRAYDLMVRWLGREQADRAIGNYQVVTEMLAGARVEVRDIDRLGKYQAAMFHRQRRRGIAAILPHRMAVPTITRKTVALRRSQARRGPPASNGDDDLSDDHHVVLRLRWQALWPRVVAAIKTPAPPAGSSRSTPYASHPDGRLTLSPGPRKWLWTSRRSQAAVASTTPAPIHPPGSRRARRAGGTKWH